MQIEEDFKGNKNGLKLLEYDYIGGHGTRGYGKVKFNNVEVNDVFGDVDDDVMKMYTSYTIPPKSLRLHHIIVYITENIVYFALLNLTFRILLYRDRLYNHIQAILNRFYCARNLPQSAFHQVVRHC